jgi:pimeloyl-ACP methyl ester carboxylesterase
MSTAQRPTVGTAVILPGTGSDEVFVRAVFDGALAGTGLRLVAPPPRHGASLAEHHLDALSAAADHFGPIVAGGISLGAHVAAEWAAAHPSRCAGLLVVLPGWLGDASTAPAALAAAASAAAVADGGMDAALANATRGVPPWLADELNRAWRRAGGDLVASLRVAVTRPAPTPDVLRRITVPAGVVGCVDDPVHPVGVAREWAAALPDARLRAVTFTDLNEDRAVLGHAAVAALTDRPQQTDV